ncbi:ABC transporter ATP-binding protein [Bacteriovoracaceae bacterium]|nr:ABC transporter ATP-binding protein [Bacteriovoracaceae bacterium]
MNLTFKPGRIHAVIGPNGAGKTTLFSCLAGLIKPSQGDISPRLSYQQIGYLFENPPTYDDLRVEELIKYFCSLNFKTHWQDLIKEWGIEDLKHKYVGNLSKGQKQKVSLALVFINDPEVIILDEPLSGLDIEGKDHLIQILLKYKNKKTIILSEHQLNLVRDLADDITILKKGETIFSGSAQEIFKHEQDEKYLVKCHNLDYSLVKKIAEESKSIHKIISLSPSEFEVEFEPNLNEIGPALSEFSRKLILQNIGIHHLSKQTKSLEQEFISRIKEE